MSARSSLSIWSLLVVAAFCFLAACPVQTLAMRLRAMHAQAPYDFASYDQAAVPSEAVSDADANNYDAALQDSEARFATLEASMPVDDQMEMGANTQDLAVDSAAEMPAENEADLAETFAAPALMETQAKARARGKAQAHAHAAAETDAENWPGEFGHQQFHHPPHREGPPRHNVHDGVDAHTGQPQSKEERRLREAENALKMEILMKARKVKDQERWVNDVETLITKMETKAAAVAHSTHKLRESIAQLLDKKRQIENLMLQKHLQKKIEDEREDLKVVGDALKNIKTKEIEFGRAKGKLDETVLKLQQEMNKLRGKPLDAPLDEDMEHALALAAGGQGPSPLSPELQAKLDAMRKIDGVDKLGAEIAGTHRDMHTDGHRPAHLPAGGEFPLINQHGILHDPKTSPNAPPLPPSPDFALGRENANTNAPATPTVTLAAPGQPIVTTSPGAATPPAAAAAAGTPPSTAAPPTVSAPGAAAVHF